MKRSDNISNSVLLHDLSSDNYHTRWFAAEVIGTKRDLTPFQTKQILTLATKSDVGEVLIWGLGMMKAPGAEKLIGSFLEHPINYFRWRAAESLRDLGTPTAISQLTHYLENSKFDETRWKCAWALGEIGSIDSFCTLWRAAGEDEDRYVRWKSIWGITKLKGNIEPIIRKKLIDPETNEYMAWRSAWILGRIGDISTVRWMENYKSKHIISKYVNYQLALSIETIKKRVDK